MQISIELVPRNATYLRDELETIQHHLPSVNTINIPDLTRLDMRSWEGCAVVERPFTSIPHLRARDFSRQRPEAVFTAVDHLASQTVLIVGGDSFAAEEKIEQRHNSLSLIQLLAQERPSLKLYGAIDPYRQNFVSEIDYAKAKRKAGACGFFTQPFFDLRLMEIYADLLADCEMFWGVAPVLTDKSYRYWVKQNKAVFPADFDGTLAWNRRFAQQALDFARQRNHHIYFMPIRADVVSYLKGIL